MAKVYFKKMQGGCAHTMSAVAKDMLETIIRDEKIELTGRIPLKVHFGEAGNKTYIPAAYYDGVIETLRANNNDPAYIETNVLYRGARTIESDHRKVAEDHGFTQIPVIIADGKAGEAYEEIPIDGKFFKSCKLGAAYSNFDQYIIGTHFKGHGMAHYGGAIKNLAMGFAARSGKMAQHSDISPTVNDDCIKCGVCIDNCDVDAIVMDDDKARIISEVCIGCAGCIAVCPVEAIKNDWGGANFVLKIAEYAHAATLGKQNIYISFATSITALCDCVGQEMGIISEDLGVFASTDPVSIDTACLDIYRELNGPNSFDGGLETLKYCEKLGVGSMKYELVKVE